MKHTMMLVLVGAGLVVTETGAFAASRTLSRAELRDRIQGAWAGQMIGVAYGAPTEFRAKGVTFDAPIKPAPLSNALGQDDLYVEMTFARVLDRIGLDATSVDFGAAFRDSEYQLWHANAAARRNLQRGLLPPLTGHPTYNAHADDIDFQIEADFIGIMCPGLPQASNQLCDRIGRVMNHGDGLYGGMFVAGMYAAAFFETDPRAVVAAGLACLPADSAYARLGRDVLAWAAAYPDDWREAWRRIAEKWDRDDACPVGALAPYNIDAKLNGAYIAVGLLYGHGDWARTLEIATRCGQDSDCNPSSAAGILGTMIGFARLPEADRRALAPLAEQKFRFTDYSFNTIVASTEARALAMITRAGGTVSEREVTILRQEPRAPALERCEFGTPVRRVEIADPAWTWRGAWQPEKDGRVATGAGAVAELVFEGTGVALVGPLSTQGGRAEVFVDGRKHPLVADAYVGPALHDEDLWRTFDLAPGRHVLRLVAGAAADPRSTGTRIAIRRAIVFVRGP